MLLDRPCDSAAGREHDPGAPVALHHPRRLGAVCRPHAGALGNERETFDSARKRATATPRGVFEGHSHPLARHQSRPGDVSERAAHDVACCAAGRSQNDGELARRRQRLFERRFVVFDGDPRGHRRTGRRQGRRHRCHRIVSGVERRAGGHESSGHGHPITPRRTPTTASA